MKRNRERGGALLAVLGFALLALAFVVIAFTESDNQVRQVGLELRQQQSLAACELGFSVAIARLNLDQSPDFDGSLAALQAASDGLGAPPTDPKAPPSKPFTDPNNNDDDGDGYADFEEAPSFAEQKALFAKRPSGSFAVRGIKIDDDTYKLRVFGVHDRDVRILEAIVRRQGEALVTGGAGFFGSQGLTIEENSFLDSYISGGSSPSIIAAGGAPLGYNPSSKEVVIDGVNTGVFETYDRSNVQVGSNDKLDIKKNSKIIATTVIGPDGSITNEGTSYVPPVVLAEDVQDPLVNLSIPSVNDNAQILPSLVVDGGFFVPANTGYVLGQAGQSSVYVFNKFKTKAMASGTVQGDVTIYLTDEMKFEKFTTLDIAPGASLKVFTLNEIKFETGLKVNDGGYPGALQMNTNPLASKLIKLEKNGTFYGVLNAPNSEIVIEEKMDFFGGLRGGKVKLAKGGNFHYDESLAGFSNKAAGDARFVLAGQQEIR